MMTNARIQDERERIISHLKTKGTTHDNHGRNVEDLYLLDLVKLKQGWSV